MRMLESTIQLVKDFNCYHEGNAQQVALNSPPTVGV